ncbi:MAG: PAS domain S-box protein [Candidatus Hydrogenedentes bacterium]|nr:PAS domain S-box protein [Candidatus Hydrogenedentota bacterium]
MKLLGKFILAFLLCGLAPLFLGTVFSHTTMRRALADQSLRSRQALEDKVKDQLTALLQAKRNQLDHYVNDLRNQVLLMAESPVLTDLLRARAFDTYAADNGATEPDIARYREELKAYHREHFEAPYRAATGEEAPVRTDAIVDGLSANGVVLQRAYLMNNPHPPAERILFMESGLGARYDAMHFQTHSFWRRAIEQLGFYNVYLIEGQSGSIVYSARKGIDTGSSLLDGPLSESNLGKAFAAAMKTQDGLVFTDTAPYLPAYGESTCFISAPVPDALGGRAGVIVFQLDFSTINSIMAGRAGLGSTGEMLLVGPDYHPRSASLRDQTRAAREASLPGISMSTRIDIEPVRAAFELGQDGCKTFVDWRGNEALIAFGPVAFFDATWALLAKIDSSEAYAAMDKMDAVSAASVERLLFLTDIIAVVAIIVLCIVADALAKPIIRPLKSTVAILKNMAEGEGVLNERLHVNSRDEVAELAHWFNSFMDKIQVLYESLELEVEERQRAQAAVEQREKYFKALIENAPDIIAIIQGAEAHIRFLSPSFARTFGYDGASLLHQSLLSHVHADDAARLQRKLKEGSDHPGQPVFMEFRYQHQDGRWLDLEVTGTHHDSGTEFTGMVLNMREITRRKEADMILREYSQTLERDVAERTMELQRNRDELKTTLDELKSTQDQLILNEKMASLGALTAGIAHEIKNPLNFVNNFADISQELIDELLEELAPMRENFDSKAYENITALLADIRQNAGKIVEHGNRADSIVRNMLLHSRGKSNEFQPTDVNALLDEYVHLTYHGMRAKDASFNIEFDLHYDESIGLIPVIPQDLSRVFLNILNNACYASHKRTQQERNGHRPLLTVRTQNHREHIEIRIRDNGTGIPGEIQERVFNPFFTTKPAGEGTGLGLSISHDIVVQEHHGELRVESKEGEYTEFTILLPRNAQSFARPTTSLPAP